MDKTKPEPDCYSADEEVFNAESIPELIESNELLTPGCVIYGGRKQEQTIPMFISHTDIIDTLEDRAADLGGE